MHRVGQGTSDGSTLVGNCRGGLIRPTVLDKSIVNIFLGSGINTVNDSKLTMFVATIKKNT